MTIPAIVSSIASMYRNDSICVVECNDVKISQQQKSVMKLCFHNAGIYVKAHSKDALYCLGYYLMQGQIPIEHAWVKDKAVYLDVTLDAQLDHDSYFSFFQFDWDRLLECYNTFNKNYPTLYEVVKYSKKHLTGAAK